MSYSPSTERELREALCEIGRRIWQREYVAANDGNFSVRLSEHEILCTPTLVSKGFMKPEQMAVITPDNKLIRGPLPQTSEIRMHLEIYRRRPDVNAVVHSHPPNATAFAVAKQPVPKCVLPEIEVFLGEIPIAPYETPGTQQFAETLTPFLPHYNAFLLASHGAVTCGKDPFEAYYRMETIEQYCRILLLTAQIGGWSQIDPVKVRELWSIREKLGSTPDPRKPLGNEQVCVSGVKGEESGRTQVPQEMIAEITRRVVEKLGG